RVRLVQGSYASPPRITSVLLNAVRVRAVRTIRAEALQAIPSSDPPQMTLAESPVLPGSLVLEIDEGAGTAAVRWQEVADLAAYGPDDRVFELNAQTGVLTFGTGVHGRAVPPGFRNVRALQYQVASGRAGKVAAKAINGLVQSAPFLTGVSNPFPA